MVTQHRMYSEPHTCLLLRGESKLCAFALQAAQDNHFMHSAVSSGSATAGNTSVTVQALKEFAGLHHELTEVQWAPPSIMPKVIA